MAFKIYFVLSYNVVQVSSRDKGFFAVDSTDENIATIDQWTTRKKFASIKKSITPTNAWPVGRGILYAAHSCYCIKQSMVYLNEHSSCIANM